MLRRANKIGLIDVANCYTLNVPFKIPVIAVITAVCCAAERELRLLRYHAITTSTNEPPRSLAVTVLYGLIESVFGDGFDILVTY